MLCMYYLYVILPNHPLSYRRVFRIDEIILLEVVATKYKRLALLSLPRSLAKVFLSDYITAQLAISRAYYIPLTLFEPDLVFNPSPLTKLETKCERVNSYFPALV